MPNRLAASLSPYLRQHADNPVDWYPWGEEALTLARSQNKPILLSIGYSACHWCHVMAQESFEDPEVAELMNRHFVNIKVDREERPDLDQIYQTAHALLTGRPGGWPLTMFLAPDDLTPIFGGTYFPKTARYNLPGLKELLPRLAQVYHLHRGEVKKHAIALRDALTHTLPQPSASSPRLDPAVVEQAIEGLKGIFDSTHGGFGGAPKFPHPAELALCLSRHGAPGGEAAAGMALLTLEKMAQGGIYDQLGGGFCRYSVDSAWIIPHFEKMLYDNGQLLALYADAWRVSRESLFRRVAQETAQWVMREMQSPEGGYYSTLDADSEHQEGKFYVWTPEEAKSLLSPEEYAIAAAHYGLDGQANFEGHYWHLRVVASLEEVASRLGLPLDRCEALLASARAKLFQHREARVHPGRDEKILVAWNALMITGLARAGRVFDEPCWVDSAKRAVDFIRTVMWKHGRLHAAYKDGQAYLNGYLDDYAFLLEALLELIQAEFRAADLEFARDLAEVLLAKFEDPAQGGFFFTGSDHEKLLYRPKPGPDNAIPSGNGVAALALTRLGHLLAETRYLKAAERAVSLFYPALARQASGYCTLVFALEEVLTPPPIVILRGPGDAVAQWRRQLATDYAPHRLILPLPNDIQGLPGALERPASASVNAWVCQGVKCLPAISDFQGLREILQNREACLK